MIWNNKILETNVSERTQAIIKNIESLKDREKTALINPYLIKMVSCKFPNRFNVFSF